MLVFNFRRLSAKQDVKAGKSLISVVTMHLQYCELNKLEINSEWLITN